MCRVMTETMPRSWLGFVAGAGLAPLTALGSYLRDARLFHPNGVVLQGSCRPAVDVDPNLRPVAERLAGSVFVRFSGGWWKTREWPDVLGCALRFSAYDTLGRGPAADDQDLLLATIRNPLTTLLAPLSTRVSDFLLNDYFGVSPFRVEPLGRVMLRLSPLRAAPAAETRAERLRRALDHGPIALELQLRPARLGGRYRALAQIELTALCDHDPGTLHFDPFASGRGLVPVGIVHGMRALSYAASRRARAEAART
jgi:hypothetical protein